MMSGRLYIDNIDAYAEFGVYVVEGGWNDLVAFPPLKAVDSNDWQEFDGIEADLSSPVLNSRDVQLKLAIARHFSGFLLLIDLLSDGAYHTFNCASIQRTYTLRLVSQPNLAKARLVGSATLRLADDFPMSGYTYSAPSSAVIEADDYMIDDVPFTDYGVRVLQGTLDEVLKTPNVKPLLLRNVRSQQGAQYDSGGNVTYKSKDVKLYCLLRAETLAEMWRNYDALLYDLIRPDVRTLYVDELDHEFPFHYKSCQVTEFYPSGKLWLQFTLTVTFTTEFIIGDIRTCLATEDGSIVLTEDGVFAIDLLVW